MSRWIDTRFNVGNIVTIVLLLASAGVTWGQMQAEAANTNRRLSALERSDRKAIGADSTVRDRLGEMSGEVRTLNERTLAQQRQLDRIERLIEGRPK